MAAKKNIGKRKEIGTDFVKRELGADGELKYRKAIYRDQTGPGVYHFELKLGDHTLYCRELDTKAYNAKQAPMAERYASAKSKSESIDPIVKGEGLDEVVRLVMEIDKEQLAIIESCVVGWDSSAEYDPAIWKRLTKDARENLIGELIGKSVLAEDENFTSLSS